MRAVGCIIVGGGLAGGLAAYRLATLRPEIEIMLIESAATAGGNHTWSFHAGDLSAAQHRWLDPFVDHRWPRYAVAFPRRSRVIETGYASISSAHFGAVLREALGDRLVCGVPVRALRADGVEDRLAGLTGLRLDPYFTGTKFAWLAEHDHAWAPAEAGYVDQVIAPEATRRALAGALARLTG